MSGRDISSQEFNYPDPKLDILRLYWLKPGCFLSMDSTILSAEEHISRIPVPVRRIKPSLPVNNQVSGASTAVTSTEKESCHLDKSSSSNFRTPLKYKGTLLGQSQARRSNTDFCDKETPIPVSALRSIHPQHLGPFQQDALLAQDWTFLPTEQPLSCRMRTDVVEDLKAAFWSTQFQTYQTKLSVMWGSVSVQCSKPMLLQSALEPPLRWNQLETFCNKATTAYLLPSVKQHAGYPKLHLACIHNIWLRYFDQKPKMDFGYYFACPIHVSETGPSTIDEVLRIHAMLCDQASRILVEPDLVQAHRAQQGSASSVEFLLKKFQSTSRSFRYSGP